MKSAAVFLSLGLWAGIAQASEPVELKLKYSEGRVLLMKTEASNVIDAAGMQITQVHEQEIEERVLESTSRGSLLRLTYVRQAMRTESPMGSMSFDSALENEVPPDLVFSMFNALVGQGFEIRVGSNGEILDIQGTETILQRIREALPEDVPEAALSELAAGFDDTTFSHSLKEQQEMLPSSPVAMGESWSNAVEMMLPGVGEMTTVTDYTLESVATSGANRIATIAYVLRSQLSQGNSLLDGYDVEGTGRAHFDITRGFVLDNRTEVRMRGEVQGMPMVVSSTVAFEQSERP